MTAINHQTMIAFGLVALGMALTPGPNMIYLISRSICQGHRAGYLSLLGVATGFLFYMICAALGITTLLFAIPYAYDFLRLGGAAYLLYLALLPQFIDPARGSVLAQSFGLGLLQICISISVNSAIVLTAGSIASFLKTRPNWILFQRWIMGSVLAALAIQISLARK